MPPETAKLLLDMKLAAERIGRFASGKSFDDYLTDELLRSGVERQFEIIGEVIKRDPDMAAEFTDYRKIAGFRNALIHGYDSIDDQTSWGIITIKLEVLTRELDEVLDDLTK